MALRDYLKKKKDQVTGALNTGATGLKSFLNKPVGPTGQAYIEKSNALFKKATGAVANTPQFNFSENIQNPIGRFGASVAEGTLNIPSKIMQNYGRTFQDIGSGKIKTGQGLRQFAGRTGENAIDVFSMGKGKVALQAGNQFLKGVKPLKQLMKEGARQSFKTGGLYGAGYGVANEAQKDETSVGKMLKAGVVSGVQGAVLGAGLGGSLPAVGSLRGVIKNSLNNRRPGAVIREKVPAHYVPSNETAPFNVRTMRAYPRPGYRQAGMNMAGPNGARVAPVEKMLPEQIVERGRQTPTLRDWGLQVRDAMPRPGMSIEDVNQFKSKNIVDAFSRSQGQREVTKIGNTRFEIGSLGKNQGLRKSGQSDRFVDAELTETLSRAKQAFRGSNDPNNYRYDNIAWVSDMPDGSKRVIYTRKNANGAEEVINWHKIDETKNPNYIKQLESFGSPDRIRTGEIGLEGRGFVPLAYGANTSIADKGGKVNVAGIEGVTPSSRTDGRNLSVPTPQTKEITVQATTPKGRQPQSKLPMLEENQLSPEGIPGQKNLSYGENVANKGEKLKERGFIGTARTAESVAPEVKTGVSGEYTPTSNRESFAQAEAAIGNRFEQAVYRAKNNTKITRQGQAEAIRLIDELQAKGRMQDAIDIVEAMSVRATEAGQSIQILSTINRLKPEGILMWAQRSIDKAKAADPARFGNLSLSPEKAASLRKLAEDIQGMTPGREKMKATYTLIDEVSKVVPSTWAQKLTTLWKAGLLTGIKGAVGGNTVGNMANTFMRKLSDVPAAAVDTAIAQITGNRSKVFTLKGLFSGAKEGVKQGVENFTMGVGAEDLSRKMDYKKVHFDTPAIQKYVDTVFNFYSASDRPYYHAALKNSLTDLAMVSAKNQGLKGKALDKAVQETISNPPEEILDRAIEEAQQAVFQDKTALGAGLSGAKQGLKRYGGSAGEIASEVVAPFTGVPSSIANAVHRYSPTGAVQGAYKAFQAVQNGNFDIMAQRNLSEALGKGMTGTGVMWLGAMLTNSGQMTLGYPTDPGERTLWEQEGKIPYAIKIGGKWRSLNYTGHIMSLMAIGGEIAKAKESGQDFLSSVGTGLIGSGKAILSSSPLQGAQAGMNALTDPQRYGDSYFRNLASSGVPTLIKDFASAGDRVQREVNNVSDAVKSRIPGLRNTLLPKRDLYGEELPNPAGPVSSIIDPFRSSGREVDETTKELRRLQDEGFGPTLSKPTGDIKAFGQNRDLTPGELDQFEQKTGADVKSALEKLMTSREYQSLGDEQKKDLVDKTINEIRRAEKERIISGSTANQESTQNTTNRSKAELDLIKYDFENSSENFKDLGDVVLRKRDDGTTYVQKKSGYEASLTKEKMANYKRNEDIENWKKEANTLYQQYWKILQDNSVDELERIQVENDMAVLAEQFNKFKSYGGFTKPKKGKRVKVPSIKNDADFIVKKMTSRLKPLRAFGRSRTNLSSVRRPGIRRPRFKFA